MAGRDLTAAILRERLNYDPLTGVFTHTRTRGGQRACTKAGYFGARDGYVRLLIFAKQYFAHRCAWLHVHGEWPPSELDHINGIRNDNRIANLRPTTRQGNMQNMRKALPTAAVPFLGVHPCGKKFRARISSGGKYLHLGVFATPEEAFSVYVEAKRRLHAGCTI